MKDRQKGFLATEVINHDSEQFDYICELHEYLWRFVRVAFPGASGNLSKFIDPAIEKLEATSVILGKVNKALRVNGVSEEERDRFK